MDNIAAAIIAAGILTLTLWVLLTRKDAWPFTRYPMFSSYRTPEGVRTVCIALEARDGSMRWWHPHFYRYPDRIGRELLHADPEKTLWCVSEVLRLIRLEEGGTTRYQAVRVIERRWVNESVQDRILARIPLATAS